MSLVDIAFPYRRKKAFGAASFAFTFLVLLFEIEALVLGALMVAVHRVDLWWELQPLILPGACLVSLAATVVFWWRARAWSRERVETLNAWARTGTTFGQQLAQKRNH